MAKGDDRKLDESGVSRGMKMDNLQKFFKALTSGDEKQIDQIANQMAELGMRPPPPELVDALLQSMEQQGVAEAGQGAQVPAGPPPQAQMAAAQPGQGGNAAGLGALLGAQSQNQASPQDAELLQQLLSGAL